MRITNTLLLIALVYIVITPACRKPGAEPTEITPELLVERHMVGSHKMKGEFTFRSPSGDTSAILVEQYDISLAQDCAYVVTSSSGDVMRFVYNQTADGRLEFNRLDVVYPIEGMYYYIQKDSMVYYAHREENGVYYDKWMGKE